MHRHLWTFPLNVRDGPSQSGHTPTAESRANRLLTAAASAYQPPHAPAPGPAPQPSPAPDPTTQADDDSAAPAAGFATSQPFDRNQPGCHSTTHQRDPHQVPIPGRPAAPPPRPPNPSSAAPPPPQGNPPTNRRTSRPRQSQAQSCGPDRAPTPLTDHAHPPATPTLTASPTAPPPRHEDHTPPSRSHGHPAAAPAAEVRRHRNCACPPTAHHPPEEPEPQPPTADTEPQPQRTDRNSHSGRPTPDGAAPVRPPGRNPPASAPTAPTTPARDPGPAPKTTAHHSTATNAAAQPAPHRPATQHPTRSSAQPQQQRRQRINTSSGQIRPRRIDRTPNRPIRQTRPTRPNARIVLRPPKSFQMAQLSTPQRRPLRIRFTHTKGLHEYDGKTLQCNRS